MNFPFHKVIITSGPTREWIDPVRYISNASSGKMGFEIAKGFLDVTPNLVYIHGNTLERYSNLNGAKNISVETTIQLRDAVLAELSSDCLLLMAAAPADFRPIMTAEHKIKKEKTSEGSKGLLLELEENPDILYQVTQFVKENQLQNCYRIGFAAETQNLEKHALEKLRRKGIQRIIGNYVGIDSGFGDVSSTLKVYGLAGLETEIGPSPKAELAKELIQYLLRTGFPTDTKSE